MTIENQIRDEKLQYDINREAAKISALSSGKIDKYEYLTGEEILPSNQQQIIEQAKLTYSPLEKAFEKQTKTIKDQGKKQANALETLKLKETKPKEIKPIGYDNYFLNGLAEIRKSFGPIDFHDLTYIFKGPNLATISFIDFKGPNHIFKSMQNGDIALEDVEKEQAKLKSDLNHINQGPKYNKSLQQLNTIKNIENLFASREEVVKMLHAKDTSKNIFESKQGK